MIDNLYNAMAIPEACRLGSRVFKKLFHENVKLGATDKKALQEDVSAIIWQYALKPGTIPIQAYEDEQSEYMEVHIIQVDLRTSKRVNRIAEIIHRAIPYPLIVVFTFEVTCAISLAHKRFSQAEKGAIVAEDFIITDWIDLSTPTPIQQAFLASLAVSALPYTHFFALYSAIWDRIVSLDCARLTGEYRVEIAAEKQEQRRQRLARCHELELQIAECKSGIRKETQFNRQVELNTQIKRLEQELQRLGAQL